MRLLFVVTLISLLVGGSAGAFVAIQAPRLMGGTSRSGEPIQFTPPAPLVTSSDEQVINIVKQASPAVVSINITKQVDPRRWNQELLDDPFSDFWSDPFSTPAPRRRLAPGPQSEVATSTLRTMRIGGGSGFFISADGMVVTNRHVVDDDKAEYTVVTQDGASYKAKILATDPVLDLAVLKVDGSNFPHLELGDSDQATVGQTVIAIGYALGEFENTVTKGVVSGLNRRLVAGDGMAGSEVIEAAIQTDAAINPGNSGGPLIDLNGRVIGINTAISEQAQSLGFALPSSVVRRAVESVQKNGRIVRPWIGIRYVPIDEEVKAVYKLNQDQGVFILPGDSKADPAVIPGSPAEKAGLKEKDILLAINGEAISPTSTVTMLLQKYAPGDTLSLKIARDDKEQTIQVTLEERKPDQK